MVAPGSRGPGDPQVFLRTSAVSLSCAQPARKAGVGEGCGFGSTKTGLEATPRMHRLPVLRVFPPSLGFPRMPAGPGALTFAFLVVF